MKNNNKRNIYFYLFLSLFSLSFVLIFMTVCRKSVGAGAIADPGDLLPRQDDISGFKEKGSKAVMNDKSSVAEAIDGAVEKYTSNGFVEGVQQLYSSGSIDIDIHIFNYGSNENAKAVFDDFYPSTPDVLSEGIRDVVIEQGLLTGYVLNYARENIFMELIVYEKSDFALNILKQFYLNIDGKINPSF